MNGTVEMDESYFGSKRKGKRGRVALNKIPVFGILERDGLVHVQVVKDIKAETLLNLTVKMVRRGSIVYTDKFKSMMRLCSVATGMSILTIANTLAMARSISMALKGSGVTLRSGSLSSMASPKNGSRCT